MSKFQITYGAAANPRLVLTVYAASYKAAIAQNECLRLSGERMDVWAVAQ